MNADQDNKLGKVCCNSESKNQCVNMMIHPVLWVPEEKKLFFSVFVSVPLRMGSLGVWFYNCNESEIFQCCTAVKPSYGEHYLETQIFSGRISIGELENDQ